MLKYVAYGLLGAIVLTILGAVLYGVSKNNDFVQLEEAVSQSWAQVENAYQRRADLIPNLVETVKGYAKQEKEVLTQVTEARAKMGGAVNVGSDIVNDPAALQNFQQAQSGLSAALQRLMVVVERYPDLKSDQNFRQLQAQLEGTENRITVERQRFNQAAQIYNTAIRQIPGSFVAAWGGFEKKAYFEATPGAETAPQVKF